MLPVYMHVSLSNSPPLQFQGHESAEFRSALRVSGKLQSQFHHPYLNTSLKLSRLLSYRDSTFKKVESHKPLSKLDCPVILDTAVRLWVWLPASYWGRQSPLEISEVHACCMCGSYCLHLFLQLYISQNNYPKWTPVTVVTEGVEAQEFAAHFSSWSWVNLSQGQRSAELILPVIHPPSVTYPATGQTKVCVCVCVVCVHACVCVCVCDTLIVLVCGCRCGYYKVVNW